MRFIHIADLHLGKMLHQYNLIQLQREALQQVAEYSKQHDIDAIIIAGDVYDRNIPSQEAVNLLNDFLNEIINQQHKKIYMISGNHDSSDRLNFASAILQGQGLYIETYLSKEIVCHQYQDCRIYMLPFFKPIDIKRIYEDAPTDNYTQALKYYLVQQPPLDHQYKNILISHQFVGHEAIKSDSELPSVGDTEIIDPTLYEDFDYVALGHLHAPQAVYKRSIRYAGSLLKYSFNEESQKKSFTVVDTDHDMIEEVPLKQDPELKIIQDTFARINDASYMTKKDDLLSVRLTDQKIIPQAIEILRHLYPNILELSYPVLLNATTRQSMEIKNVEKMSKVELYKKFYKETTQREIDEESLKIITDLLEQDGNEINETN